MNILNLTFNLIGELLYPSCCCHCGKTGPPVCQDCYEQIEFLFMPVKPDVQPCYLDSLTAACRYTSVIKSVIKQMKFHSVKAAGEWCGQMLYYTTSLSSSTIDPIDRHAELDSASSNQNNTKTQLSYLNNQPSSTIVTSIPLHPKRQRVRGFNQAEEIAKAYAALANLPYQPILKRTVYSAPQAQLRAKSDREHHLTDHFVINPSFQQEKAIKSTVILIDDVVTTGSTLNECARVLKATGYQHIHGLTVAHGL